MTADLQQLQEELRKDRLQQMWRTFGPYVLGVIVLLVVFTGLHSAYKAFQHGTQEKATLALSEALMLEPSARIPALQKLAADSKSGAAVAYLSLAGTQMMDGKAADTVKTYEDMRQDSSVPSFYRDLAVVMLGYGALDTGVNIADDATERLQKIAADKNNAWRPLAVYVTSIRDMRAATTEEQIRGIQDKAKPVLVQMSELSTRLNQLAELYIYSLGK